MFPGVIGIKEYKDDELDRPNINEIESVKTEEVIKVVINKGTGESMESPFREEIQYWTTSGRYIGAL